MIRHRSLLPLAWGLAVGLFVASPAQAYNWMIRHGYASCAACHTDPSGAGLLTQYGRAQFELLVGMPFGEAGGEGEVSPNTGFLFGAVELPEWLNASLALRGGGLVTRSERFNPVRPVVMVTEARGAVDFGAVKAGASIGVAIRQADRAALTSPVNEAGEAVGYAISREHWIGYASEDQTFLLRAGRLQMPFGIRNIEHNSWVREYTDTDINQDQQHGVAIAFNGEGLRGELMAIAGNFQVKPDLYRERGYSFFVESALGERAAAGISSRVVLSDRDLILRDKTIRQSHGVFARYSPFHALALLSEFDALVTSPGTEDSSIGFVGWLQADLELVQGLHVMTTLETVNTRREGEGYGVGGWLSTQWWFAPHTGIRMDAILRRQGLGTTPSNVLTLLAQLHTYL